MRKLYKVNWTLLLLQNKPNLSTGSNSVFEACFLCNWLRAFVDHDERNTFQPLDWINLIKWMRIERFSFMSKCFSYQFSFCWSNWSNSMVEMCFFQHYLQKPSTNCTSSSRMGSVSCGPTQVQIICLRLTSWDYFLELGHSWDYFL